MRNRRSILSLAAVILLLVVVSCNTGEPVPYKTGEEGAATEPAPEPTQVPPEPTEEPEPEEPAALPPTEPPPMEAPQEEPEQLPMDFSPCAEEVCVENGSFLLSRPVDPAGRQTIDPSFRYGDYRQSTQLTHRGVDFLNSTGTSVVAAADGVVVVAGDDLEIPYGPRKDYYGNLVILEHNLPGMAEPIFTLYSQLSEVLVEEGQAVVAGEQIALVGMTGVVPGSTLHFEVRLGDNSYQTARNPELWLELMDEESPQPLGALAGSITNGDGTYEPVENIVIEQLAGPGLPAIDQFYLTTYEKKELRGQSPWYESFALSDLPAGEYQITFMLNGVQQMVVEVQPGMLTLANFVIE